MFKTYLLFIKLKIIYLCHQTKTTMGKLKITKTRINTMSVSEYAKSKLYKGKEITTARVTQLIRDNIVRVWRKNPTMVYADKIESK